MIHHFSLTARSPEQVAAVLAEIIGGQSFPLAVFHGSHIAVSDDPEGTAIEVYPLGTELVPGGRGDAVHAVLNSVPTIFSGTHAALSVNLSEDQIRDMATRLGWRTLTTSRRGFPVFEFWVENRVLIELLTPSALEAYRTALRREKLTRLRSDPIE